MSWHTHEISNQFDELCDYNLYASDKALQEGVQRAHADWFAPALDACGTRVGSAASYRLAEEANRYTPELKAFDRRGRRIDQVEFHPSWHALMGMYRESGLVSLAFADDRPGRWVAATIGFYLHAQLEAGTMCPVAMTQASIPLLQKEPAL